MIEVSRTLPINDGALPALSVDDVWAGLVDKAENPLPYVEAITDCTVVERFEGGLIRDIVHAGPVREVVTFYPQHRVHFVRTHGTTRGTIDNEIVLDDAGQPALRFTFRLVADGVEEGSPEEAGLGESIRDDYLNAVRTTLRAVRERVAKGLSPVPVARTGPDGHGAPAGPPSAREVLALVDTRDADAFGALISDQARFTFGNMPQMIGRDDVVAGVRAFYDSVASLRHTVVNEWQQGSTVVAELSVTYGRHDGGVVTIPVSSIWTADLSGKIEDYRVFFDLAPVYA